MILPILIFAACGAFFAVGPAVGEESPGWRALGALLGCLSFALAGFLLCRVVSEPHLLGQHMIDQARGYDEWEESADEREAAMYESVGFDP